MKEIVEKRGVSREVILLCLAIFFADASHSTVIPIFPAFAQQTGASLSTLGSYGSISALAMLLFSLPLGRLSDKHGRKHMMIPGLILFIIVPLSYLLVASPLHLYPVRLMLGLGVGLIFSNGFLLMTEISEPGFRNTAQGMYMTSMGIGFTLGPLVGGFTAKLYGYTTSFLISAVFGFLSLLLLYFVEEKHRERSVVSGGASLTISSIIKDPKVLAAGVANYLNALMFNALTLFFPVYGASVGFDESEIGSGFTARGLASTLVRLPVGALTGRVSSLVLMVFGLALSALTIYGVSEISLLVFVSVLLGVQGIAYGVYLTSGNVYVAANSDEEYRGTAMAVYSMFGNLSGIINPLILGVIAENYGAKGALQFSSAFTLLGLVIVYMLARNREQS
ncbi:MAG: MFS transporter [Candidatus Bathyarchaeota archaeon]|nr:MFS transporter [Candidatus Bathyarchaeota archaeon]